MNWKKIFTFPAVIAFIAAIFLLVIFLTRILWAWTIPDLFPGAVEEGLIAAEISYYTAFKLTIFVAILVGLGNSGN